MTNENRAEQYAILWDLDGTITESIHCFSHALSLFCAKYQYPREITEEEYRYSFFGKTFGDILKTLYPEGLPQSEFDARIREYFENASKIAKQPGMIKTISGVVEVIQQFQTRGIPQSIASSSNLGMIIAELDAVALLPYFDNIIAGTHMKSKPAPDIFLAAAACLNTPAECCIVFEDSVAGIQAAKAAGMFCVGVASTNNMETIAMADWVIPDFSHFSIDLLLQKHAAMA